MTENLTRRVASATKWSALTEIVAKLVAPITSMVLAHLLVPEAFGVVASLTMIISFAEIFTDAGFQKYLVQHEFIDDIDRDESANVAFWSNLILSFLIWGIIALFADQLTTLVGNPGLGNVLIIACVSIPLAAFSSIQMALYKRDLDFKTLFKVRIIGIAVPIIVTIPLALCLRNYWALVIGTIAQNVVNAFVLTVSSKWKPRLFYSLAKFKEMFSYTMWSMIEAISIWLTGYFDVFIIGRELSQYYLGLYKTGSSVVGQIMGLITATTTPILFSALSKLQNEPAEFENMFFKFQKLVGIIIIPVGVGLFCFSDFLTDVLLGNQWKEASGFIGLWALMSSITIVLSHYSSEVFRALGRPKLSVLNQWLHIIVLWPTVLIAVKYGFKTLYVARSLIRFEGIIVNMMLMSLIVKISSRKMLINVFPACVAASAMWLVSIGLAKLGSSVVWEIFSMLICAMAYLAIVWLFPQERGILKNYVNKIMS